MLFEVKGKNIFYCGKRRSENLFYDDEFTYYGNFFNWSIWSKVFKGAIKRYKYEHLST